MSIYMDIFGEGVREEVYGRVCGAEGSGRVQFPLNNLPKRTFSLSEWSKLPYFSQIHLQVVVVKN